MRLGILTYGLDRAPSGIGRYVVELTRALARLANGPEIVLLTTERQDQQNLWARFEHHALPGCRLLPILMAFGSLPISDAIRRYKLDLVHDPNGIAPFLGLPARAHCVVTIHDAVPYVHPETHNRLDNWRYRHHLPSASRRADAVTTVSECSRRDLLLHLGLDPERVQVIPGGVDRRFEPSADDSTLQRVLGRYAIKQPYVLCVGGINPRKNISRLFEAYAQVRERHPELTLVVAGQRQWQTHELDATFQRLNLVDRVRYTGYVDDVDLPLLYSAAKLFVFPSLYEGFGLPPLEAMACGTPVVTSNTSSLPEVVGDAALLVDPYDVGAIAEAMRRVLADPALATDLRARGLARAQQFTWEHTSKRMVQVYERVLDGPAARK